MMKKLVLSAFALCLFALPLIADFSSAKKQAEMARASNDTSGLANAISEIGQSNDPKAVSFLLKMYGYSEKVIASKMPEKAQIQAKIQKLDLSFKKDRNGKVETNSQGQPLAANQGDAQKYGDLYPKGQELEKEVLAESQIQAEIVKALASLTNPEALDKMIKSVTRGKAYEQIALAEALGQITDHRVGDALAEALSKTKSDLVRVALLDALGKHATPAGVDAIAGALADTDVWQVKAAAADALSKIGDKKGIEPLINALEDADGRLKHDINEALKRMTGENKHGDYHAWKAWWDSNKGTVMADDFQPVESGGDKGEPGMTTFYGIPVVSKRVVFILDRSGSMAEPAGWKPEAVTMSGGEEGGPDPNIGDKKIDVAKYELEKVVRALPDDTMFNIIFYNHEWTIWKDNGLVKASSKNKDAAIAFFKDLPPEGGTNVFDPTEKAFNLGGGIGAEEKNFKNSVDTIYLLSDGLPNAGQITEPDQIRQKLQELNKVRKIVINTIGVFISDGGAPAGAGQQGANVPPASQQKLDGVEFMKGVADENQGTFVER